MKKIILFVSLFPFVLMNMLGCVPLLIGAAIGGVAVYAVSKDTVQGDTDKPYDTLWSAALRVCKIRGAIKQEDSTKGCIELETGQSRVYIRLIRLTRAAVRLKVSARKFNLPNINLAQDIFVKIIEEAK